MDRALEVRRLRGSARLGSGRLQVRLRWVGVNPRTGATWPDTWQDVFYGKGEDRRCGVNPSLLRDIRRLEDTKYGTKIGARSGRTVSGDGVIDGGPAHERGTGGESGVGDRGKRARDRGVGLLKGAASFGK